MLYQSATFSLVLFGLLLSACSRTPVITSDANLDKQFHHVPKHAVVPGIAPHHVAIVHKKNITKPLCSGALINQQWVLTASQCLKQQSLDHLLVVAGTTRMHYWAQRGEHLPIKSTHIDPQSKLALIQLKQESQQGTKISFLRKDAIDKGIVSTRLNGWGTLNKPSSFLLSASESNKKHCVGDLGSPVYGKHYNNPFVLLKGILLQELTDCSKWKYIDVTEHSMWIQKISAIDGINPAPHPPALPALITQEGKLKPYQAVYFPYKKKQGRKYFTRTPAALDFTASKHVRLYVQRKNAFGHWKTTQIVKGNNKKQRVQHTGQDSYWRWIVATGASPANYKLETYIIYGN